MTVRLNIDPYYKKIADYYWDELDFFPSGQYLTLWAWLHRDYGIVKVRSRGSRDMLVQFPDEEHKTLFLLRWS